MYIIVQSTGNWDIRPIALVVLAQGKGESNETCLAALWYMTIFCLLCTCVARLLTYMCICDIRKHIVHLHLVN